jgi:hypothetical protein
MDRPQVSLGSHPEGIAKTVLLAAPPNALRLLHWREPRRWLVLLDERILEPEAISIVAEKVAHAWRRHAPGRHGGCRSAGGCALADGDFERRARFLGGDLGGRWSRRWVTKEYPAPSPPLS